MSTYSFGPWAREVPQRVLAVRFCPTRSCRAAKWLFFRGNLASFGLTVGLVFTFPRTFLEDRIASECGGVQDRVDGYSVREPDAPLRWGFQTEAAPWDRHTGAIGILRIKFVPEPSGLVILVTGVGILMVLYRIRVPLAHRFRL
jgi:hypothetical protein